LEDTFKGHLVQAACNEQDVFQAETCEYETQI